MEFYGDEDSSQEGRECQRRDKEISSAEASRQHQKDATSHRHPCRKCSKVFHTANELTQHMVVHKQRNLQCWGSAWNCNKTFKSPAHVFLHLQTGTCKSGITTDQLLDNILKCDGPWKNPNYNYDQNVLPFQCPTCDRVFSAISSFLQHVESPSCEEGYNSGRLSAWGLLKQLRRNLKIPKLYMLGHDV